MARPADKQTALGVLRKLRREGYEALFAGGCVRDMLLGVRSSDYDVATSARPEEVSRLFRRVLLVGAKFGVAIVLVGRRQVEVATFRSDVSYSDGRRPDAVRFSDARADAMRRDFTINGMFVDPLADGRKVIDYVGGGRDLQLRIVRTIGEPDRRFEEDYLRMIRAVRFASRLGFEIDLATAEAVQRHAAKIRGISGERVFDELSKMLSHPSAPRAIAMLAELGLAGHVLAELFEAALWGTATDRLKLVAARRSAELGLAALLCELDERSIRRIARRWGASNDLRDAWCFFARNLPRWSEAADLPLCEFKRLMSSGHFREMLVLWRAEEKLRLGRQTHVRRVAGRARAIPAERVAPAPLVTGDDLKSLGLAEGPALGRVLRALCDAQLNEEIATRAQALRLARRLIAEGR